MTIGVLRIQMRLPAHSLKEKRMVVKSVVERVRTRFNVSAAEVADMDTWSLATIAVVCVSNEGAHAEAMIQNIARAIEEWRLDVEILDVETELIPF